MSLRIPRHVRLEVDVRGSGDIFVTGMRSDMNIDGGKGDVDVIATRDLLATVKASVAIGKAELWLGDSSIQGTGFPKSLKWSGAGDAELDVDLGTGEVRIRLEASPPSFGRKAV